MPLVSDNVQEKAEIIKYRLFTEIPKHFKEILLETYY